MKPTALSAFLALSFATLSHAQITYFDAPSSESGTTQINAGITAVWQQFNGTDWVDFDDSLFIRAYNTANWELRINGPATNASGTTVYQVGDGDVVGGRDASQIRVILSGFDPTDSVDFFIYNVAAAGVAAIQSAVSLDTAATGLYGSLTTFSSGGTNVLSDGTEGIAAGDPRIRYGAFSGFTGSSTYVLVLDDFAGPGPGDRATLDGFGVKTTPVGVAPEFGTAPAAYSGGYGDDFAFTYPATGNPVPTYQWQFSPDDLDPWTDLAGEESATLSVVDAEPADNGYYRVVATNSAGTVTSPSMNATLAYPLPTVSLPGRIFGVAGQNLSVTATSTGIGALTYEWHKIDAGGDTLLPETSATLSFTPFTEGDVATYYVTVTDDGTGVTPAESPVTGSSSDLALVQDPGPIAYFDAPSGNTGTTQAREGVVAVWQQFDGTQWIDFDDSLSTRAFTSGGWEFRDTGPGANANGTTVYTSVDTSGDSAQIRVVLSGFNPADVLDFYFYNVRSAGAAKIQSLLTTDITATGLYTGLTAFATTTATQANVDQVLADGTLGDPGAGDRRFRTLAFPAITGASSYAFVFDDFDVTTVGDRASLDGLGIAGLPSVADYATWIAGYDVGALTGFEDDADGDGLENGLENFFGTDPAIANRGMTNVMKAGNALTFMHPKSTSPAPDLAAAYLWSRDLATWYASGEENGGTTVTIAPADHTPAAGVSTVTATIVGPVPSALFTRVEVNPAP